MQKQKVLQMGKSDEFISQYIQITVNFIILIQEIINQRLQQKKLIDKATTQIQALANLLRELQGTSDNMLILIFIQYFHILFAARFFIISIFQFFAKHKFLFSVQLQFKVEMKQCYYELLEVDKKATDSEIKKSYKKLALKYHPDKNPSEDARDKFLLLTEAYEVLSDPNQRTWYDNNREKILFNKQDMTKEDVEMYSFGFNIWAYFTSSCYKGFEDSEGGFYHVYRDIFEKIKAEEAKAFGMREDLQQEMRKYQGFGDSKTIVKRVLQFYDDWQNFTTYKTFVWVDDWDVRQAPNRYVKREMEKQNKKQRQKEKKNYIKTIKDLASFLKKRDPRYREYLIQEKKKEEERQLLKKQKEEQKKKQKEEMKKIKQQMEEQRFKQIEEYYKKQEAGTKNQQWNQDDENDADFYCAICDKQFKSQNQLRNHQNSKMHKQNIKLLQKEVMSKSEMKQKATVQIEKQEKKEDKKNKKNGKKDQKKGKIDEDEDEEYEPPKKAQTKNIVNKKEEEKKEVVKKEDAKKPVQQQSSQDDTDAFMNAMLKKNKKDVKIEEQKVEQKKIQSKKGGKQTNKKLQQSDQEQEEDEQRKKGKAKLRKQKKMANKEKQKDNTLKCNVCSESFTSKTKLFEHLNKTGHAKAK